MRCVSNCLDHVAHFAWQRPRTNEDGETVAELRRVDLRGVPRDDTDILKPSNAITDARRRRADTACELSPRQAGIGHQLAQNRGIDLIETASFGSKAI